MASRVVVVSGASRGIGAAAARRFGAQGATVVVAARSQELLEKVADDVRAAGGDPRVYAVDLSNMDAAAAFCSAVLTAVGVPDLLVNNAGAGSWLSVEETTPAEAMEMMAVPYLAAFALDRGFVPAMVRAGRGRILHVTSPASFIAFSGATAYSAARAAVRSLNDSLHAELRGTGVSCCLVVAGLVDSTYFEHSRGRDRVPKISRL